MRTTRCAAYILFVALACMAWGWLVPDPLSAATRVVPVSEETTDLKLDPLVDVFVDNARTMALTDVMDKKKTGFWFQSPGNLNFGFTESAYWVRVEFKNESDKDLSFMFEIAYPVLDLIQVNIVKGKDVETLTLGDSLPFDHRPKKLKDFVFPLSFSKNEQVSVFIRFETVNAMQMPLTLYNPKRFIEAKQVENISMGLYYGAMVVLMIYNLFLFSSIRDVDYLYYSFYVCFLSLFLAGLNGINFQYFFPNHPQWNDKVLALAINGIVVSASLFAVSFLKLKQNWPRNYRLFMVFPVMGGILFILSFILPYNKTILWSVALILAALFYGVPLGLLRWLKGFQPARFYILAWVGLAVATMVFLANKMGLIPRLVWTENATKVGSVFQVILLSISLADRLNMERKEKIEAQKKAQQEERAARISQEKALQNEKKERAAREEVYAIQKKARETLEVQVEQRTKELDNILAEVKLANSRIMSSLRYARIIQVAMLPDPDKVRRWLPNHFIWWVPRDVVGGDFYYVDQVSGTRIVCVADCTGHGVHGAFMTIISGFELKRIIRGEGCVNPDEILSRLNKRIRSFLKPDTGQVFLDDGLSLGICSIHSKKREIRFAGARMNLHVQRGTTVQTVKGDRYGVGFMVSSDDTEYAVHHLNFDTSLKMYLATDGITHQPGERSGRRFGSRRLKQILTEHAELPLKVQHEILEASLNVFKGKRDQVDDMTMMGFSPDG